MRYELGKAMTNLIQPQVFFICFVRIVTGTLPLTRFTRYTSTTIAKKLYRMASSLERDGYDVMACVVEAI